jgi:SAM-dependent methyltransferase
MSWYTEWFDEEYVRVYGHRDLDEARRDVAFAERVLNLWPEDRILDLCCGNGRHLAALCEKGYRRLAGIDLSMPLLRLARRAMEGRCHQRLVAQADMRCLPFCETFDAVLNLFTSFGYFDTDGENLRVLNSMASVLRPGGRYILDYLNPEYVARNLQPLTERTLGDRVIVERRWIDPRRKRVNKTIVIQTPEAERHYKESVRIYTQDEMEQMLKSVGLKIGATFGDFESRPISPESPRMIFAGER